MRRRVGEFGFTLIELLVVIAIIALLLSIITPALGKAKIAAQKVICRSNMRQMALGATLYSQQHNGDFPVNTAWGGAGGAWFWDISYWSTNQMTAYAGLERPIFYCPSERRKLPDDGRFWNFSDYAPSGTFYSPQPIKDESTLAIDQQCGRIRVLPYLFVFDQIQMNPGNANYGKSVRVHSRMVHPRLQSLAGADRWIRNAVKMRSPSSREMILDAVIEGGVAGGLTHDTVEDGWSFQRYGVVDSTNHLRRQLAQGRIGRVPDGGNAAYADGSVSWQNWDSMFKGYDDVGTDFFW